MKKLLLVFVGLALLSGCVTVNEGMLRAVESFPEQTQGITVEVQTGELVQKHNGEGSNSGVFSGKTVLDAVATSMMNRWKEKNVIADWGKPNAMKTEPDYTLTISGERNEDSSIAGAVLSGLTMMILPTSATLTYDLELRLTNNHSKSQYSAHVKNGMTTYMQILLLPALPFAFVGSYNALNDMADYSFDELRKQGAFAALPVHLGMP